MTVPTHIAKIFALFADAYPSWSITSTTLETWTALLADLDPDAVIDAAVHHGRVSKFPPTIAEIREFAKGPRGISAEEAWLEVHRQIRSKGWTGKPEFSDANIGRAVEAVGGWRSLCSLPTVEMGFARAHFLRCFNAYLGRQEDALEREALADMRQSELKRIDDDERRELGLGLE